jgi:hypothetical protein
MTKYLACFLMVLAASSGVSHADEPDPLLSTLGLQDLQVCNSQEAVSVRGLGFAAVLGDSRTASWLPGFSGGTPAAGSGYSATHIEAIGEQRAKLYHASHTLIEFDFGSMGQGPAQQIMGHIGLGSVGKAGAYSE